MSKQCESCKHWIQDKEVALIRQFYDSPKMKNNREILKLKAEPLICTTCLFLQHRPAWELFAKWVYATRPQLKSIQRLEKVAPD